MKRLADQTLYEILDVRKDAPAAEIQAACDRARDLYGPGSLATYTLMTPDEAALLAKRIDEARATLLDPDARARYDEGLERPAEAVAAAGEVVAAGTGASEPAASPVGLAAGAVAASGPAPRGELVRPAILLATTAGAEETVSAPVVLSRAKPILLQREVPPQAGQGAGAPSAAAPEASPAPPLPVVPDGAWTGDALRQVREARGLTVQQIAERTKVTRHHIENIEEERFGALPAPVYLRGILLSVARELRLDGQKVARAYLDRTAAALAAKK